MEDEFKGFRKVNRDFAKAQARQNNFEKNLKTNLKSLANTVEAPFAGGFLPWVVSPQMAWSLFDPSYLAGAGTAVLVKAGKRAMDRNAGNKMISDVVSPVMKDTGNTLSGILGSELSQRYLKELNDYLSIK